MKSMINEVKLNSQICTSVEQSQRLLELGLKPETADMELIYNIFSNTYEPLPKAFPTANKCELPAWSLHRLIIILNPTSVEFAISTLEEAYEDVIYQISESIKNGYINKEYLNQ